MESLLSHVDCVSARTTPDVKNPTDPLFPEHLRKSRNLRFNSVFLTPIPIQPSVPVQASTKVAELFNSRLRINIRISNDDVRFKRLGCIDFLIC